MITTKTKTQVDNRGGYGGRRPAATGAEDYRWGRSRMQNNGNHLKKCFRVYLALSAGTGIGILVGSFVGNNFKPYIHPEHNFPATENVQSGYAVPKNLQIRLKDLDGNGDDEVFVEYEGRLYPLKLAGGMPVLEPAEE